MPERVAIYPGSFDPPTLGHLDIVRRAAKLFDKFIIAVARNSEKNSLFTADERTRIGGRHGFTSSGRPTRTSRLNCLRAAGSEATTPSASRQAGPPRTPASVVSPGSGGTARLGRRGSSTMSLHRPRRLSFDSGGCARYDCQPISETPH